MLHYKDFNPDEERDDNGKWSSYGDTLANKLTDLRNQKDKAVSDSFDFAKRTVGLPSNSEEYVDLVNKIAEANDRKEFLEKKIAKVNRDLRKAKKAPEKSSSSDHLNQESKPFAVSSQPNVSVSHAVPAWYKSLSDDEQTSIKEFTIYGGIANQIRKCEVYGTGDQKLKKITKNFQNALDKAPKFQGTLYRGLSRLTLDTYNAILKGAPENTLADSSATKNLTVGEMYVGNKSSGRRILQVFHNTSGADISDNPDRSLNEDEVVIRKGTKYVPTFVTNSTVPGVKMVHYKEAN